MSCLISGHKYENVLVKMGEEKIWKSFKKKLLGMEIRKNLNFDDYVSSLCRKVGRKLAVLARLSKFVNLK